MAFLGGSVITAGVTGLGSMTENKTGIKEMNVACQVLSAYAYIYSKNLEAEENTLSHIHIQSLRLYEAWMRLYQD